MLNVAEEKQPNRFLASISYGFDRDDEMAGPFLDPLNPQSEHAFKLLEMVSGLVLSDRRYLKRLERHYRLVKKAAVDPSHPAYDKIHKVMNEEVTEVSLPQRSTGEQVGRNDPCPCGSGKKYKYCCMLKAR
ncbi:MAG TPA: hypothetical protein ENN19_00670 [Chloroflexi bacterium]|nr:hypothetical protein [Chloroflexota bacterium]